VNGFHVYNMSLMPGKSLKDLIYGNAVKKIKRVEFSSGQAVDIAIGVARALADVHKKSIYRDVKASNTLVSPDPRRKEIRSVSLIDFGLVGEITPGGFATETGVGVSVSRGQTSVILDERDDDGPAEPEQRGASGVLGTPQYMSPSQAEGKRVWPSDDIYALGITLFETVTGGKSEISQPSPEEDPAALMSLDWSGTSSEAILIWTLLKIPSSPTFWLK
jgi:serine/threonine protein kinase